MILKIAKDYLKGIDENDQYAQLARNIEKKILRSAAITTLDAASIIATPIITSKVLDKIDDTYSRRALKSAAAIIFGYQVLKTIRGAKDTQEILKAYTAATEMIGTDIPIDPYPDMQPTTVIEISTDEYNISGNEEDIIDEKIHDFEEPKNQDDDVEDEYNFKINIGDPVEEEYVDPTLR